MPGGPGEWRRLNPRMLLVHPVQETVRFLPALLAVFVTGRSNHRNPGWDWAALGVVVLLGVSRWFTTRYRIWNAQIELRSGLLRRRVVATPADRVRTVDVTAPIWHRLLGLARVEIGTAGHSHGDRLVLDALAAPVAARLRDELLHRISTASTASTAATAADAPAVPGASAADGSPAPDVAAGTTAPPPPWPVEPTIARETVLLDLDPAWIRYAPLTTSGLVSALTIWGFGMQYLGGEAARLRSALEWIEGLGTVVAVLVALAVALVAVALLAVTAYVLSYWGFRLSRHGGGTLHTSRGLLTTRATSIEEARVRGVELSQPLGLRVAHAARLQAITTGLRHHEQREGSGWLTPPAPVGVVTAVAHDVVGEPEAIEGVLVPHGRLARRRRWTRAVGVSAALAGLVLLAERQWGLPVAVVVLGLLPLLASPLLATDRYAALGHLLTPRHLVVRSGSITRRRDVLERDGVVGVVLRESFFQRRLGLGTLTATTAAGRQGYHAVDLPVPWAVDLATALLPGQLEPWHTAAPQAHPGKDDLG